MYDNGETSGKEFYTVYETDLSEEEKKEYLLYKQLTMIKTIKNCTLFLAASSAIGMIVYFLIMLSAL